MRDGFLEASMAQPMGGLVRGAMGNRACPPTGFLGLFRYYCRWGWRCSVTGFPSLDRDSGRENRHKAVQGSGVAVFHPGLEQAVLHLEKVVSHLGVSLILVPVFYCGKDQLVVVLHVLQIPLHAAPTGLEGLV